MKSKKLALVTGGNRGIGYELAKQLAKDGFHVIIGVRNYEQGKKSVQNLEKKGLDVSFIEMDVSLPDSIYQAAVRVEERYGTLDVLVNNAGIYLDEGVRLLDVNPDDVEKTIDTNFLGPFYVIRAFLPLMEKQGYGRIINISSGYGAMEEMARERTGAYKLSKLALNGMTRLLAAEVRGNIKINAVCPGWVRTDMGGPSAPRSAEQAAASILWLAKIDENGPNGGFFRDGVQLTW